MLERVLIEIEPRPIAGAFSHLSSGGCQIAAQACKWRNGSINDPQDVPEGDAFGGQEKIVPAEPTALACKYPMMLELHQNLLEKWAWNLLALGNLARAQRTPGASKCDESMKSVFGSLRDHERLALFSKISI